MRIAIVSSTAPGSTAFWELDLFGRVRRSIEARAAERDAAEASLHDVLVSLLAEMARNYFELRGTSIGSAVAWRNANNQRETLVLTVARLEGGRGTRSSTCGRGHSSIQPGQYSPARGAIRRAMHRWPCYAPPTEALVAALQDPAVCRKHQSSCRSAVRKTCSGAGRISAWPSATSPLQPPASASPRPIFSRGSPSSAA